VEAACGKNEGKNRWRLRRQVEDGPRAQKDAALFYVVKCERLEAYMRYAGRAPANVIYLGGWANRNDQFEKQFADAGGGASVA